jgi:hypothetical protein
VSLFSDQARAIRWPLACILGAVPADDRASENPDHGTQDPESTPERHRVTAEYSDPEDRGGTEAPEADEAAQTTVAPEADADGREFWKPLGFDTHADYMRYLRRMQTLHQPLPRGSQPPAPRLVGAEAGDVESEAVREIRSRQVNVKLRRSEGADLDRAARIYGLAPSTLARLLVNRGVKAILDEY